jgi:hypothetical protein
LLLGSGEGIAGRVLRVSLNLVLNVGTDVHFTARTTLKKFTVCMYNKEREGGREGGREREREREKKLAEY